MTVEAAAYHDCLTALADIHDLVPDAYQEVVEEKVADVIQFARENMGIHLDMDAEFAPLLARFPTLEGRI